MERVCLDANILLELLFARSRREQVVEVLAGMNDVRFCVSALCVDLVIYFVEAEKQPKAEAWRFLENYEVLDQTRGDVEWARDNDGGDFESGLQIATARRVGAKQFVTLDQGVEKMYGAFLPVTTVR